MSALPAEIVDMVLLELQSNDWQDTEKRDLSACAQVCRNWRDAVRKHLFSGLTVSFRDLSRAVHDEFLAAEGCPSWRQVIPAYKTPYKTLKMLREFLQESQEVAQAIRRLKLVCYPSCVVPRYFNPPAVLALFVDRDDSDLAVFASVLRQLPHLRELTLVDVVLERSSFIRLYTSLQPSFPSVEKLTIHYDDRRGSHHEHVDSMAEDICVIDLASCFADVTELHVSNFGNAHRSSGHPVFKPDTISHILGHKPKTAVHSLSCSAVHPAGFFEYLLGTESRKTLKSLDFGSSPWTVPKQRFLDDVGSSLVRLCIPAPQLPLDAQPSDYGTRFSASISAIADPRVALDSTLVDLAPCRTLERVTFALSGSATHVVWENLAAQIRALVGCPCATTLQEIGIDCDVAALSKTQRLEWASEKPVRVAEHAEEALLELFDRAALVVVDIVLRCTPSLGEGLRPNLFPRIAARDHAHVRYTYTS